MEPFYAKWLTFPVKICSKAFSTLTIFAISSLNSQLSAMAHCGQAKDGTVPQIWHRFLNPTIRRSAQPRLLFSIINTFARFQSSHLFPAKKKRKAVFMPNRNVDNLPKVAVWLCFLTWCGPRERWCGPRQLLKQRARQFCWLCKCFSRGSNICRSARSVKSQTAGASRTRSCCASKLSALKKHLSRRPLCSGAKPSES